MNLLNEADGARVSTRRRANPNLGLIYGIHIDESDVATIDMTLTSAACPLTDVIEDQAKTATDGLVQDLRINWVWMPPWGPDKITDDGRDQLRALGFNV
ncbi:metal-sulfur cluster assembly factor [Kitasatospora sp. NPDC057738]|uniref:metal-sulfur cluster assembly factor n=1 Tax=Kitasatospora sp. NPDC057738 TaxID=3346233 RepID=UPI00338C9DB3